MQQPVSSPSSHLRLSALALTASIAVLVGAYLFWSAGDGVFAGTAPLEFKPADAVVIRGESLQRGSLWAPTADADGVLIIRLTDRSINTALFPTLDIAALADTPPIAARLLWRQAEGARTTFAKTIAWRSSGHERIALAGDSQWGGQVAGLALAFKLQPKAGVLFRSATLQPDTGLSVLSQIAGEWLDREPWGQYSVNYLYGGAPNPRLPMVPAVFVVAAIAFLIYRVLAKRKGFAPSLAVGVIFAIGAWVVYYLFPLWVQPTPDPLDPRAVLAVVESAGSVIDPAAGTLRLDSGRTLDVVTLVDDPMVRLVRMR